jgi:hypothetical protein
MKTSNKILLIAYGVIVLALSIMIFVSRPLVEKALIGRLSSTHMVIQTIG